MSDPSAKGPNEPEKKDPLRFNKIAGGLLAAFLFALFLGYGSDMIYHIEYEAEGYPIEVQEVASVSSGSTQQSAEVEPVSLLLAMADPAQGESVAKKCAACHIFMADGPKKTGPSLWNIIGSPVANNAEFGYSDALAGFGGVWDYETLNAFLANPKGLVKGTRMSFAGLRKVNDRAALIAYLRTLSDSPQPLP